MGLIRSVPRGEEPPHGTARAPEWAWIPIVIVLVAVIALVASLFTGEDPSLGTFLALFLPILPIVAVTWLFMRMRQQRAGGRR